jgi:hypothetical protein
MAAIVLRYEASILPCAGRHLDVSAKDPFEPVPVSKDVFLDILREAVDALERARVPALVMGGIASATLGRDRWTYDIDFFIYEEDAKSALKALAAAGFRTQERDADWLYKGIKHGVLVDLIFRSTGDVVLDEEMFARARCEEFYGEPLRVLSAEDLLIIKAVAHTEETPRYWYDALGLVAAGELDWSYLLHRSEGYEERVLSLLLYARSEALPVPDTVIRQLVERICVPNEYLIARLQEAFVHDERTDELGITIAFSDGWVVLSGTVPTPQRREAVLAVAREVLGGRALRDEIVVAELCEPQGMETLGSSVATGAGGTPTPTPTTTESEVQG